MALHSAHPPATISDLMIPQGTLTYVGCSNTDDSVQGYQDLPVTAGAFVPHYSTGGGSLGAWYDNDLGHREIFEGQWETPFPIWWNICIRSNESTPSFIAQADEIADWLISEVVIGSVTRWVSAVSWWDDPPSQIASLATHDAVREHIIAEYGFLDGPVLGPLTSGMLVDGTHPNATGRAFLGAQLAEFFDPYVT